MAVFVPVAFMGGIVGRFLKSFGLTMAFAIVVSLLVSFTLTPTHVRALAEGRSRRARTSEPTSTTRALGACSGRSSGSTSRMLRMVDGAPRHRRRAGVLVLLSCVPIFRHRQRHLPPQDDQAQFEVSMRAPEGTSLEATEVIAERVAAAIRRSPTSTYTLVTVGGRLGRHANPAGIYVRLNDPASAIATSSRSWSTCAARSCRRWRKSASAPRCRRPVSPAVAAAPPAVKRRATSCSSCRARELDELRVPATSWPNGAAQDARRWSTSTPRSSSASPRCRCSSIATGGRPRRAGRRRGRRAAAARGRRSGLDLRRGGRAVRRASARRGAVPRPEGAIGRLTVPSRASAASRSRHRRVRPWRGGRPTSAA